MAWEWIGRMRMKYKQVPQLSWWEAIRRKRLKGCPNLDNAKGLANWWQTRQRGRGEVELMTQRKGR